MNSPLTPVERTLLRELRGVRMPCAPGCPCEDLERGLADQLRQQHPDVDDVTIARIVLTVACHVSTAVAVHGLTGPGAGGLTARVAVELASFELDHPADEPGTGKT
ncbi:hypothetical protein [Actinomadura sp. DC4]|uniref:hypothetical protein n=1 Tax=Actinomadura sp. DC4 TaxID=3055069 RepID=UPI0025B03C86|nr:hypothetical protein [Actinomadura sp. DC4]MDN3356045.1 hypothetical protein [Actinomadura sp. DC4]